MLSNLLRLCVVGLIVPHGRLFLYGGVSTRFDMERIVELAACGNVWCSFGCAMELSLFGGNAKIS